MLYTERYHDNLPVAPARYSRIKGYRPTRPKNKISFLTILKQTQTQRAGKEANFLKRATA